MNIDVVSSILGTRSSIETLDTLNDKTKIGSFACALQDKKYTYLLIAFLMLTFPKIFFFYDCIVCIFSVAVRLTYNIDKFFSFSCQNIN